MAEAATLVSLPEVAARLGALVDDPQSSAEDIGRMVSQDAALTTRLPTRANSAMSGMPHRIDTGGRAMAVFGTRQVCDPTLGLSAVRAFGRVPNELGPMGSCWHHNALCAVAARSFAAECPRGRPDSSFVAGSLHDVDQRVLFNKRPDESRQAPLMTVDVPSEPDPHRCEREIRAYEHAAVGGSLARRRAPSRASRSTTTPPRRYCARSMTRSRTSRTRQRRPRTAQSRRSRRC